MTRLVLVALIALSPAFGRTHRVNPCGAYADLLSTGHLSVRVKLDTVARGDQWAIKEALAYWSTVLDLDVTVDNNFDTCNLEVVYGSGSTGPLASTIMPHYDGYDGTIRINTFNRVRPAALVAVLIHEIGHLMGLCHTRDKLSIMYYLIDTSQSVNSTRLAPADIEMAGRFHALRHQAPSGILLAHGCKTEDESTSTLSSNSVSLWPRTTAAAPSIESPLTCSGSRANSDLKAPAILGFNALSAPASPLPRSRSKNGY